MRVEIQTDGTAKNSQAFALLESGDKVIVPAERISPILLRK